MFELTPHQDVRSLREIVQRIRLSDLTWSGTTATDTRDHYLKTIEALDLVLRQALVGWDWIEHLQTPGYWVIRDMSVSTGRPLPLIESECKRLDRWLLDFEKELSRVEEEDGNDRESVRLVLDTSAVVRHKSFSDINWTSETKHNKVRLVLPILVIRQLDQLKDSGKATNARKRLRMIRNVLEGRGRGPAPLQQRNVTLELLMDPPRHTRLSIADEEVVRRALYLQGRPGGVVLLVTGDYTMQFMAEADGLPVLFLPEGLRTRASDEASDEEQI